MEKLVNSKVSKTFAKACGFESRSEHHSNLGLDASEFDSHIVHHCGQPWVGNATETDCKSIEFNSQLVHQRNKMKNIM